MFPTVVATRWQRSTAGDRPSATTAWDATPLLSARKAGHEGGVVADLRIAGLSEVSLDRILTTDSRTHPKQGVSIRQLDTRAFALVQIPLPAGRRHGDLGREPPRALQIE